MRFSTNYPGLLLVCLGLACLGPGCNNSSVNESGSTGATGADAAPPKDSGPPPKSVAEYYQRQQTLNPPITKKGAGPAAPTANKAAPQEKKAP